MTMQEDDVVAVLRRLIESREEHRGGPITGESDFIRDLELDSVSRTGVLVAVEEHYGITLDANEVLQARTVSQLAKLVLAQLASK